MRAHGAVLTGFVLVAAGCGSTSPAHAPVASGGNAAAFAVCMGSHGFTAAVGSAASAPASRLHVGGVTFTGNVDPRSPQFQAAMQACRKDLPAGGPLSLTPAQQAEWSTAMARFAACMRRNGVPGFATPQLGKPPAHQGIDTGSPLVQTAFKACESLEPTVGPRIAF